MSRKTKSIKERNKFILPLSTELTGAIIQNFIKIHLEDIKKYDLLESYLYGNEPLMTRISPNPLLAIHDFAGYIVNMNSAYLVGNQVQYQATEGIDIQPILDIYKDQTISDLDSELAQDCSIYGKAIEVVYSDESAEPQSAKVDVRSAIIIRDDTFKHNIIYAITLTPVVDENGQIVQDQFKVSVFDDKTIKYYNLNGASLDLISEDAHFFGRVPVIEYKNNKELRGDYESVISLIDAYNILQSDRVIDREKLVDAILAFYGTTMSPEQQEQIKQSRVVTMPSDAKGEYIIKNINEADADVLRSTIAKDIHKFSKTPDMTDEQFSGNSSGVAISYKLLPFEENCRTKERYFESALMERFKIYNNFLAVKSVMPQVSVSDVDAIFTRTLPKNDLETSQMINNLDGIVDKPLLASQLSFVKDGEETTELARKESEEDMPTGNFGQPAEITTEEEIEF